MPEPDTPVITTSLLRGMVTVTFFKLWTLAPFIYMPCTEGVDLSCIFLPIALVAIIILTTKIPPNKFKTGKKKIYPVYLRAWVP